MKSDQLRQKFLDFFKNRGHKIIPSSSLIPDDSSVLLTTAGMQQFVPYLSGQVKPPYKTACSVQKCFRINDIEEVGDQTHHTFFEMLGNWSFGGYFKEGAVDYALDFLVKECGMEQEKLWITIFKGEGGIPKDKETAELWVKKGIPKERISEFGVKENFWGPVGPMGPCGPCSELHYDLTGKACSLGDKCRPNCSCGRFVEIWNLVFMEYNKDERGQYQSLPQKNIDTGIGFERLSAILQKKESAYQTDLFEPIIKEIKKIAPSNNNLSRLRIIADHIRASCFLIADGVIPSNIEQGYILRRLLRRMIGQGKLWNLEKNFLIPLAEKVIGDYSHIYPELKSKQSDIITVVEKEEEKFSQTIEKGIKQFEKITTKVKERSGVLPQSSPGAPSRELLAITGQEAFELFSTYGLPLDMISDLAEKKGIKVDEKGFEKARREHQWLSRAGAEKKFGGHGLGEARVFDKEDEEKVKKLHTATHLLHQALCDVLGQGVQQMGSDINPERLRFDFSYSEKMTTEQIKKVEDIVNEKIKENLPMTYKEMGKDEAIKSGAKAFFKGKYDKRVRVYSAGPSADSGRAYSKEICGGPHVENTGQLGHFKIKKEESSSAGVRRIKAVLR